MLLIYMHSIINNFANIYNFFEISSFFYIFFYLQQHNG
jgi:hypothetical protein